MEKVNLEFLHNYLWHKNPDTNMWAAFKKEDTEKYFSNNNTEKAVKSKSRDYIMDYLIKINNNNLKTNNESI